MLPLRQRGRILLNTRINRWQGRAPDENSPDMSVWEGRHRDWTVVRHVPKRELWAISTHSSARVHHKIKYQLVATHKNGTVVKATVWKCSARCSSEIKVGKRPNPLRERCWTCSKV